MKRLLIALMALALLAAACGDDDDTGTTTAESSEAIQQLQAAISADASDGSGSFTLSNEEALCVATGVVNELGVGFVTGTEADFTAAMAAASAEQRASVVNTILGCADITAAFTAELEASGVSADSSKCVADGVAGSDWFPGVLAAELAGESADLGEDPSFQENVLPIILGCLSPDELANLG